MDNREGFHLFVFPFQGRAVNEGIASLMALRMAREVPRTFSITTNEYGFEILCADPFSVTEGALRRWLCIDKLLEDLLASVNISELARRQFRRHRPNCRIGRCGNPAARQDRASAASVRAD